MVILIGSSGYFDCQRHNYLNFVLIFKIVVSKHISFPRPSILIYSTSTWHVPTWPETCPKDSPWKMKITKVEKNELSRCMCADFFHIYTYKGGHLSKEKVHLKLWAYGENWPQWFDLSLSLHDLSCELMDSGVCVKFLGQTVRSFWGTAIKNCARNVGVMALWNTKGFWTFKVRTLK